jgi:methyl-accepting chemotaxis protein
MMVESAQPGTPSSWWKVIQPPHRLLSGLGRWAARRHPRAPAATREWEATLRDVEQHLASFNGSAEGVFLKTGKQLMELQLRAREIATQTTSVAELLSNDGGSLTVLDAVLQRAGEDRQDQEIMECARTVQEKTVSIHRAIESFDRLVNTFDVLGMMTRVESARLEASGGTFTGLADTVMTLSRQTREHVGATAHSADALLKTTSQAGQEMRRVARVRRENLGPLASQAGLSIQKIGDRRKQVADANAQIAVRFQGVSGAIGDVVQALQSHDIVRQQIEHVVEALHRVDLPAASDTSRFATVRLQAAQLDNSRTTFERSVEQIRNALVRIEANVDEIALDAASLLAPSDAASEASFVSGLEANLAGILKVLESNAGADRLLGETVVAINQRLSEISGTIAGVQTIGFEMHRIALNATIQAAHLGEDGGAMEIVASSVQGLSREAGTASSTIEDRLCGIRTAAQSLQKAATRGDAATQIAELSRSLAGLNSMQQQASEGLSETTHKIADLRHQITDAITAFGDQSDVRGSLMRAVELLHDLSPATAGPAATPAVEQIAGTYTMQSERDVHNALFDTPAPPDQQTPSPAVADQNNDDNIELF